MKGVEAGVDLVDFLLSWRQFFCSTIADVVAASFLAEHSSVAGRVLQHCREQGHGGFSGVWNSRKSFDGLRRNQRSIAREHDDES